MFTRTNFYAHEIATVSSSNIYFLKNANKICKLNYCNLNRDCIIYEDRRRDSYSEYHGYTVKVNMTLGGGEWVGGGVAIMMLHVWQNDTFPKFAISSHLATLFVLH